MLHDLARLRRFLGAGLGCGICEHECPVTDEAAIRVTAAGETRSKERRLLMDGGVTSSLRELEKRQR